MPTLFFEKFREALVRLPAGLIRTGPAAKPADIAAVEKILRTSLPAPFVSFLESFDGADLFHEAVLLGGVGSDAPRLLLDLNGPGPTSEVVFAEAAGGDRFLFARDGRVVRLRGEPDAPATEETETDVAGTGRAVVTAGERWLAGPDFSCWLEGTIAHQRVLYGPDGEFAPDAFEPDGIEVLPLMALRQTERALRACPESAEWHHERGVALRRLDRLPEAREAFARAAALDPQNPWAHFALGRAALDLGPAFARAAGAAFETAALQEKTDTAARLWVWAARAAQLEVAPERLALCRQEAVAREPGLADQLRRAREAARDSGDSAELAEAEAMVDALEQPPQAGRKRLAVIAHDHQETVPVPVSRPPASPAAPPRRKEFTAAPGAPARQTPPPGPRRPGPATPRRPGARPRVRSR